jgi:hypothetical protein
VRHLKTLELPSAAKALCEKGPENCRAKEARANHLMAGIVARAACGVKKKGYKILG